MGYFKHIEKVYNNMHIRVGNMLEPIDGPNGGSTIPWGNIVTLSGCGLQPYDGSRSLVDYGFETRATMRLFSAPTGALVENAGVWLSPPLVKEDGTTDTKPDYEIVYIARWTEHYECLLEKR